MLKNVARKALRAVLGTLAKVAIKKHRIKIVAITGDGKSSLVRELVYNLIKGNYPVRRNVEIPDTEFFIPLTVLGVNYYPGNLGTWIILLLKTILRLIFLRRDEHYIVLEIAFIEEGIFEYWIKILNPLLLVKTGGGDGQSLGYLEINDRGLFSASDYSGTLKKIGKILNLESIPTPTKMEYPKPRIDIIKRGELTVINSSYIFKPPPLRSAVELAGKEKRLSLLTDCKGDLESAENFKIRVVSGKEALGISKGILIVRIQKRKKRRILQQLLGG